ncbi:hypothetical protein C8J56DRAFT_880527 [Mycena floridula]|nr:hypothetical protein C8J56DRAFT_880527 [Mycena floridula]
MESEPLTEEGLKKLTVPQLKALCKDRKVVGYSKLAKPGIIDKLLGRFVEKTASDASKSAVAVPNASSSTLPDQPSADPPAKKVTDQGDAPPKKKKKKPVVEKTEAPPLPLEPTAPSSSSVLQTIPVPVAPSTTSKRPAGDQHDENVPPAKKAKTSILPVVAPPTPEPSQQPIINPATVSTVESTDKVHPKTHISTVSTAPRKASTHAPRLSYTEQFTSKITPSQKQSRPGPPIPASAATQSGTARPPVAVIPLTPKNSAEIASGASNSSGKRVGKPFTPLFPKKPQQKPLPPTSTAAPIASTPAPVRASVPVSAPVPVAIPAPVPNFDIFHLDFPIISPVRPAIQLLSLPPKIAQRKLSDRFSVALMQVPQEDLQNCVLVSRMLRAAVYQSARHQLSKTFSGARLTSTLSQLPPAANVWPLLRSRQREQVLVKQIFNQSFLGQRLQGADVIADKIWANLDHEKQATVAVRFLLTRLFFSISVGQPWIESRIVEVKELVQGEVWAVTVQEGSRQEIFHVLESTCEVVGRPPPSQNSMDVDVSPSLRLRADWTSYIEERLVTSKTRHPLPFATLIERLKWSNHEEYEKGISKLWLTKIAEEGNIGAMKLKVAERYILACVVANRQVRLYLHLWLD